MGVPYVVSQDAGDLLSQAGILASLKAQDFIREELTKILRAIFPENEIHFIANDKLTNGLFRIMSKSTFPSIWQNHAYRGSANPENTIEVTRAVQLNGESVAGLTSRHHQLSIEAQIAKIASGNYTLIDDVIFSGQSTMYLVKLLAGHGITIREVIACIVVGSGHEEISKLGIEVNSVCHYDKVKDEVCERDFIIGIPYGGRAVIGQPINRSIPYTLPWGKPVDWASVPDQAALSFSKQCIAMSIIFWEMINPKIKLTEVPQLPINAPDSNMSFLDYLHQVLRKM